VPNHDRVQVLALDGGGLRGLFSAHILACLERDLGVTVRDHFDLITGTSAGDLIALALGAGIAPSDIIEAYAQLATTEFQPHRRRNWLRRVFRPTYSVHALRVAVESLLGARVLADARTRLVIPAYDVARGTVHVFKTPHHPRLVRDGSAPMVDVALATAAAPTYLRATVVDDVRLVDGGLWASNPSVVGICGGCQHARRSTRGDPGTQHRHDRSGRRPSPETR
jgi:patatin-like phospholipase/acyl hydrolase